MCRSWQGGATEQEIDAPANSDSLGWTPDGHALTYLQTQARTRNLYMQPLAGGAPVQLIHFDSEPSAVTACAWTNDGKKIAISYNVGGVKLFSSILTHALGEERHLALIEKCRVQPRLARNQFQVGKLSPTHPSLRSHPRS